MRKIAIIGAGAAGMSAAGVEVETQLEFSASL